MDGFSGDSRRTRSVNGVRTHRAINIDVYKRQIIDHIIDELNSNKSLLGFISKNLGWGVFKSALHLPPEDDGPDFYSKYLATVKADQTQYQDPEVMLFTIIELTSSTCFNSILHGEPLSIEEYKPHLYRSIRAIIREYAVK